MNEDFMISTDNEQVSYDILAFGDSLTEGYCRGGSQWRPYTAQLQKRLAGLNSEIQIQTAGISGETVDEMLLRLPRLLKEKEAKSQRFTHVIILGGTNNLGSSTPNEILDGILALHSLAEEHGSRHIVVTIPEASFTEAEYNSKRQSINNGLREYAAQHSLPLVDLEKEIPHLSIDKKAAEMWDDELHFSPAGYDQFGSLIFDKIKTTG